MPQPQPARGGWFARWFGRKPPQPGAPAGPDKPARQPRARRKKDPLFSPETHPGLTAEDCEFLNTPLGKCDPEKLRVLADALSQQIAAAMGPALGMDADALFATFCERLFLTPGDAAPDAPPAEPPCTSEDAAEPASHGLKPAIDAVTAAALEAASGSAAVSGPADRQSWRVRHGRPPLRFRLVEFSRHGRTHFTQRLRAALHRLPPPRRLCYAACAGPP